MHLRLLYGGTTACTYECALTPTLEGLWQDLKHTFIEVASWWHVCVYI